MNDIEKDIEAMAEKMEKSVQDTAFTKEMLQATVLRLGKDGLKKALPRLSGEQKAMLNEVLEDMKKSHKALIARDKGATTEPQSNSTPADDYLHNEDVKPAYTEHDETLNEEARKRGQMVHRNQGGNNPPEGWQGQVIKADGMGVKEPEEKNEQKKKEDKAELDAHKNKSPSEEKYGKELNKAGEEAFGGDGDRIMKCGACTPMKKCAACMKKSEKKEGKEMNLDEKKKSVKEDLPKMMTRMQERKMEKGACIAQLAKHLEVGESKLSTIWDVLAKGSSEHQGPKEDKFKYDDGKTGTAPSEATEQSRVPEIMKGENEASVHDPDDPATPSYEDKSAKKIGGAKKPESGQATETADETIAKVPETMNHKGDMKKSGYWHEEDDVYLAKAQNPFAHRTTGQNVAYKVDEYVELEHASKEARLSKSTFDYLTADQEALEKGYEGFKRVEHEAAESGAKDPAAVAAAVGRKKYGKEAFQHAAAEGKKMHKSDPEAEAKQAAANLKQQQNQADKDAKEAQRQAQVDEKLTRIEERAGPKIGPALRKDWDGSNGAEGMMKMKKSFINDLLEKNLDMGDDQAIVAQTNRAAAAAGAFLVKSFNDSDMDELFKTQDMWKKDAK